MSKVNYPSTSPYAITPQTSWNIGLYNHRAIPADKADRQILIGLKYNLRPDRLAFDLYGSSDYWWVFMVRNMNIIRDPIWDFQAGVTIFVPSAAHLRSVIG